MCEIAIFGTEKYSAEELAEFSMDVYHSQRDSLGVVAVAENDDRTKFKYHTYKALEPRREDVRSFIQSHEAEARRFIVHGRLATHGAIEIDHAHPLEIDCDECNIDYVVHNGICRASRSMRRDHEYNGHDYETAVDSEIIAHEYGDVPLSFDEETDLLTGFQPGYILLNEDAMYINNGGRYHLTEYGHMAKTNRPFARNELNGNYVEVIIKPEHAN